MNYKDGPKNEEGMPQPLVTGYSWNRDKSTGKLAHPLSLFEPELLAEAWADVEYNTAMGREPSPVNKALHKMMVANLRKHKHL